LARKGRARLRALTEIVRETHPELDAEAAIAAGRVLVGGCPATNPRTLVRAGTPVALVEARPLRGEAKLVAALDLFAVPVSGRITLDVGAAAGGFTRVLLRAGARRVYAVDVGHGQLLGSLRRDPAVVALERTNLAHLDAALVPEPVELVTADLSYVSLAAAVPQLRVELAPDADLIALVKPQFELGLPAPPESCDEAVAHAVAGIARAGWRVVATAPSPVTGRRGAAEALLHARR
jgi:23S rRNA (cytidine1920-2'-O)/16S rRNA (cytidine1409-2'-O)-methyltransferase